VDALIAAGDTSQEYVDQQKNFSTAKVGVVGRVADRAAGRSSAGAPRRAHAMTRFGARAPHTHRRH